MDTEDPAVKVVFPVWKKKKKKSRLVSEAGEGKTVTVQCDVKSKL